MKIKKNLQILTIITITLFLLNNVHANNINKVNNDITTNKIETANNRNIKLSDKDKVNEFITALSDEFEKVNIITDKNLKTEESFKITNKYLDIKWMGNFILGKNRKTLTPKQVEEFVTLFSKFLINNYLDTLAYFSKSNLTIKETKELKENNYMTSISLRMGTDVMNIDLKIVKNTKDNKFYIIDIIPENVSFLVAQRSEIDSILNSKGYDFLINSLK